MIPSLRAEGEATQGRQGTAGRRLRLRPLGCFALLAMTTRRGSRGATAGFLLTETLATFTISAFVLLGLVSAASVLLRAVDRSVARVETVDDLGRAMAAITRDIEGLQRARWNGIEPQGFVFRGTRNSLFFARRVRAPDGSVSTKVVALREIVTATGPRLTRGEARLSARAASFDDLVFGPQREIWTGAARLRFAYVPQARGRDEPSPRDDWPVGREMPAAILIQAVDRDTRRALVTSRVTIAADADIGCVEPDATPGGGEAAAAPGAGTATSATTPASTDPGGSGGVDFGAVAPPERLPDATQAAGAAAAKNDATTPFCGRADADARPKAPGTPGAPAQPPPAPAGATL